MRKRRFTESQIVTILRVRETDKGPVAEFAKKYGISEQSIYTCCKRFGTMDPADFKRLRQLEQENPAEEDRGGPRPRNRGHETLFAV